MVIKKIISIMLVLLMSISLFGGQRANAAQRFVDVPTSLESYKAIDYIAGLDVITGYIENGKDYFKPSNSVTRGQVAKMVVIATGNQPLTVSKSSFTDIDIKTESELSGYVERAVQLGFFEKSSDGKFNSATPILRGEMSYVLANAFKLDVSQYANVEIPFSDITTNYKYQKHINALYFNGITQGDNGKYNPSNKVTRAHFALFVARAKNNNFKLDLPVQGVSVPNEDGVIGKVKITTDNLNIRSTANASVSTNKVGQVDTGAILPVYADIDGWLKVSYNGKYAYVSKSYTSYVEEKAPEVPTPKPTPTPPPVATTSNVKGRVTVSDLNVRSGAGSSYSSVGTINKGDVVVVQSISNYWAKITFGNNKTGYVHKSYLKLLNQSGSVLKNRIIVIDPGHGGKDPGTSRESTTEKAIVLKVASLVRQKLEANGAKVVMTRTGDTFPTLEQRVSITDKNYGEIFVSIHVNAASSASAKGTETYYSVSTGDMYAEDVDLATFINKQIVQNADMNNRGVKKASYYVTRSMVIPSVLVELGFISSNEDRAKLESDKYISLYAESIYNGIVQYYGKQ